MASELPSGSTFAGYRIEGVCGRGGMGVVYKATQMHLERVVALKLITPDLADDSDFRERFKRESMTAARIEHPNVIPVYEAGEADDRLFITMRFVEGTDLRGLIRSAGRLEPARAAAIVAQVAAALDAAHGRGLVHRDVKPANVLVAGHEDDHAYLTDFGLTKSVSSVAGLTRTGQFIGTPDYAAPEQIQGHRTDARVDVYALGCVLFHALTGDVPYRRDSEVAKIYAHLSDPPPTVTDSVEAPPGLDEVVKRALAKQPGERYPSAGDLGRAAVAAASGTIVMPAAERSVATGAAAPTQETEAAATREAEQATQGAERGRGEPEGAGAPATPRDEPGPVETVGPSAAGGRVAEPPRGPAQAGAPGAPRRGALLAAAGGVVVLVVGGLAVAGVFGGNGGGAGGSGNDRPEPQVTATIDVGGGPDGMAVDGGLLWVTDQDESVLRRIDIASNRPTGDPIPTGANPDGVAAQDGTVWVASADDPRVTRFEVEGDGVTQTGAVDLPGLPEGLSLGEQLVWVTSGPSGTISRVDRAETTAVGEPIDVGSNVVGVFVGEEFVYVTDKAENTMTRIDTASAEIVGEATQVGDVPRGVVEADGVVWVANSGENTVSRLDASSGRPIGDAIQVGENPRDVTFANGFVWVANTDSGTVTRIDAGTGRVAGKAIRVGVRPASIVAGAGSVWVSNSGEGTISRISP